MKYVNTYANNTEFASDKSSRLDTLDDIWAAYVIEDNKTTIKLRQPPAIATYYKASDDGILQLINVRSDIIDSIVLKDSSNTVVETVTQLFVGGGCLVTTKSPVPAAEYTAEFVFKTNVDANLTGCFSGTCVQSLSKGFFSSLKSISHIQEMFKKCTELQSLPTELFICGGNATTDASHFCDGCTTLEFIPEDLFSYLPNITTLESAFKGCKSLYTIVNTVESASSLFTSLFTGLSKLTNVNSMFYDTTPDHLFTPTIQISAIKGYDGRQLWHTYKLSGINCFADSFFITQWCGAPVEWGGDGNVDYLVYKPTLADNTVVKILNNPSSEEYIIILNGKTCTDNYDGNKGLLVGIDAPDVGCFELDIAEDEIGLSENDELHVKMIWYAEDTTVDGRFKDNNNLMEIPGNLFDSLHSLNSARETFMGCTNLVNIGRGLFKENTDMVNFTQCFYGCEMLGEFPKDSMGNYLWTNFPDATANKCFTGCMLLEQKPEPNTEWNAAVAAGWATNS